MRVFIAIFLLCAALFADSLDQIRQNGVIRIGVRDAHPPLCESNGGKFEGFEIDLANAIAKEIFGKSRRFPAAPLPFEQKGRRIGTIHSLRKRL